MAKKGKRYALRDVRMTLRGKNYKQASRIFANARIKKGQEAEAEKMQEAVICGQALDLFKTKDFSKCLNFLEHQLKSRANARFSNKLSLFRGLCYFFLTDFEKAKLDLEPISSQPPFSLFQFYYLLCLIFESQKIEPQDLPNFSNLPQDKQGFLKVILAIKKKEYSEAANLLAKIETNSRSEFSNKEVLLSILNFQEPSTVNYDKIRPLYRAMSGLALSEIEIQYLSNFSLLTEKYKLSNTNISSQKLTPLLEKLCHRGESLSHSEFQICLKAPEEILPTIIYNHIAALRNENFDENFHQIISLIKSHYLQLCKVPEFIFLYEEFTHHGEFKTFKTSHLRGIIIEYVKNLKNSFVAEKAEQIGWNISQIALQLKGAESDKYAEFVGRLYVQNPSMRSLSWNCLTDYGFSPDPNINWAYLDIFAQPLSPFLKKGIKEDLLGLLLSMRTMPSAMFDFFGPSPILILKKSITQVIRIFEELITKQPPIPTDNFPLELMDILGQQILSIPEMNLSSEADFLIDFPRVFEKYLTYFEEPENSIFRQKYADYLFERNMVNQVYTDLFSDKLTLNQAIKDGKYPFKVFAKAGTKLVHQIDNEHFSDDSMEEVEEFLSYAHLAVSNLEVSPSQIMPAIEQFAVGYKIMASTHDCEHPSPFFYEMLAITINATPKQEMNLLMAEAFLKNGKEYVLNNSKTLKPQRGILVAFGNLFLELQAREKKPGLDPTFFKELVDGLGKIASKKRDKQLKETVKQLKMKS